MVKSKIRILALALVAVLMTMMGQASLAYYQTVGTATNVVTSGSIRFLIHETTDQGTAFPQEGVYIVPGDVVSKRVTIESDCDHPFYLRVKRVYGINAEELPAEECLKLDIDTASWALKDGWYYYTDILQPGAETPAVFSQVEIIGSRVDNNYLGKTLSLSVLAQAVQSENNPIMDNDTSSAQGWPAEQGGTL